MATTSARLLTLLSLLQARRDWPGAVLADRLGVSARTVRRDVDRLRDLGYPIDADKGPDGGYRLGRGARLPPLLFDDDQAVAVSVALQLAPATGAVVDEAAARALATLRQVLPDHLRRRIDAVPVTATGRPRDAPSIDPRTLAAVGSAVHAGEVLRFDYRAPGGSGPARRVEPHGIVAHGGRLYLVAFDLDRQDWRTFRLDRLQPHTPTGPRFRPRDVPGGDVAALAAGHFRGTDGSTSQWPCVGEVLVELPVTQVAPYVDDGRVEEVSAARTRLVLGAWSWPALAARLGQLDADLEVVEPPPLRAAFAALAARFARAAGGPGNSGSAPSVGGSPGPARSPADEKRVNATMVDFGGLADKAQGLVGEHSEQVKGGIGKVADFVDGKLGDRIGHDRITSAENALSGLVDKLSHGHADAPSGAADAAHGEAASVHTTVDETPGTTTVVPPTSVQPPRP